MDEIDEPNEQTRPIIWDIHREGRAWTAEEFPSRAHQLLEEKLEISEGKLFWSDATRVLFLGMLLENMGMDAAVRLGDLGWWKEAVAAAEREGCREPSPKRPGR